jgi:exopolysaccharide production protein ExoQ
MSKASIHSIELGRARSSTPTIDACTIVPILACAYSIMIGPLIYFTFPPAEGLQGMLESRTEQRIFWPALAAISVILVIRNRSRLGRDTLPPNIVCLFAYLTFAGASGLWAFRPELSFIRFAQEVMVLASIVLPGMLAVRTADLMRGLFLCFALAAILNVFFVFDNPSSLVERLKGYPGYFTGKNLLGEFAAITFLLSLHEVFYPGLRRALGIIMIITSTLLLLWSNSRTSHGLALVVPFLAALTLLVAKRMRISPAIILLAIPICYAALSGMYPRFNMYRVSYALFGDATFSGRSIIWEFALKEIELRPLLGWGYQSFWLVGPDAPSIVDAPGFIKTMPNAHNGYYDTMLEMGYVGYALLVSFVVATLHGIGRVAERDLRRAWLLLSLALYVIIHNGIESTWMRAFDLMWVVFLMVATETGRHWQLLPLKRVAYAPRTPPPRQHRAEAGPRASAVDPSGKLQ